MVPRPARTMAAMDHILRGVADGPVVAARSAIAGLRHARPCPPLTGGRPWRRASSAFIASRQPHRSLPIPALGSQCGAVRPRRRGSGHPDDRAAECLLHEGFNPRMRLLRFSVVTSP